MEGIRGHKKTFYNPLPRIFLGARGASVEAVTRARSTSGNCGADMPFLHGLRPFNRPERYRT